MVSLLGSAVAVAALDVDALATQRRIVAVLKIKSPWLLPEQDLALLPIPQQPMQPCRICLSVAGKLCAAAIASSYGVCSFGKARATIPPRPMRLLLFRDQALSFGDARRL